jgi:hypothetical protein
MAKFTTGKPEMGGGGSFAVLPKGDYKFEIVDTKWKKSQAGNRMIEMKLCVGEEPETANVWENIVFTESAFWKFDQLLKAIGNHPGEGIDVEVDEDADGDPILIVNGVAWNIDDFIGQRGELTLKVGKNNKNEDRNEVVGFIWPEEF